jgi:hypothetical protein
LATQKETIETILSKISTLAPTATTSENLARLIEGGKYAVHSKSYPELTGLQKTAKQAILDKSETLLNSETDLEQFAWLNKSLDNYLFKSLDGTSFTTNDLLSPMGGIYDEVNDCWYDLGHNIPFVQMQRRRVVCIGNPMFGGEVYRYLDPNDSSKFEDGNDATAYIAGGSLDGSSSTYQVYVEEPKFYHIQEKIGGLFYMAVSLAPFTITSLSGQVLTSSTHPQFRKSGWTAGKDGTDSANEYDYAYKSAFEGVYFDDSEATQKTLSNGNLQENGVTIDSLNDKILSVANLSLYLQPATYITRGNARALIANASNKQWSWHQYTATRLLYLCEYKNHNSQSTIGGYTEGGSFSYGKVAPTGTTLSLGNKTGAILNNGSVIPTIGGVSTSAIIGMSYRGEENIFGNIWKWCDGINVSNWESYVCDIDDAFVDDTFTGDYLKLGVKMPTTNGYQAKMQSSFLPEEIGSSSSKDITDYYYQSSGSRVVGLGGALYSGSNASLACFHCSYSSSNVGADIGSR